MQGQIGKQKITISKEFFVTIFVCLAVIVYFLIYAIFGNRGIVDYFHLKSDLKAKNLEKDKLFIQIQDKQNLVNSIRDDSLDIDLLDEQVRKNLGYATKNEIVIYNSELSDKNSVIGEAR